MFLVRYGVILLYLLEMLCAKFRHDWRRMSKEAKFFTALIFLMFSNIFWCFAISILASQVIPIHTGHIMIVIFCAVVFYKMWFKDER